MPSQCNTTLMDLAEEAVEVQTPLWQNWTFHQLGLLLSVAFGGIACLIALLLIFMHATHYSKPHQQRHIIRILFMIPVYATISVVSYKFYKHALYWEVLRDCYEAFAISSFFALLCNYLDDTLKEQKNFFRTLIPKNWVWPINWAQPCTGGKEKGLFRIPRSGLTWFNIIWVSVFQYCVIRVAFTFVAMITQLLDMYCESSLSPGYAHVWVMSFNALSVTVAMYCLIQFYVQLRETLADERPFLKVACIKLVIFFSFWQTLLISFLSSGTKPVITTGPRVSYVDVKVGIPCVLLTFEMAIFAVLHIFAFPWKRYQIKDDYNGPRVTYQGGPLGIYALMDAFNPWDIIKAAARGFRWLFVGIRQRHTDPSYDASYKTYQMQNVGFPKDGNPAKLGSDYDYEHDNASKYQHNVPTGVPTHDTRPGRQPTLPGVRLQHPTDEDYGDNNPLLQRPYRTDGVSSGTSTPHQRYQSQPPYDRVPLSPVAAPQHYPPHSLEPTGLPHAHTADERIDAPMGQSSRLPRQGTGPRDDRRWDDRPR